MNNTLWMAFTLLFGVHGICRIILDSIAGYLMCYGVLVWLFIANNTDQLFIEKEKEDEEEDY